MFIIGERLNTSIPEISEAVKTHDVKTITIEAQTQVDAGASALDINAGTHGKTEMDDVLWLLTSVQDAVDVPVSLDSSNPEVIKTLLNKYRGRGPPIINSINGESSKLSALEPILKEHHSEVIALAMDERGIANNPGERLDVVKKIVEYFETAEIDTKRIYVDPLVVPVSTDTTKPLCTLGTLQALKQKFPELRSIVGLSNISFGLPKGKLLNRTFLAMLLSYGLDAAIMDPTDKKIMSTIKAADVLLNYDEYCGRYILSHRKGNLI